MSIIYVPSNKVLDNAVNVSQYIMNLYPDSSDNYKLITIIGESHTTKFPCDNSIGTINTPIEEFVVRTPDIKTGVILEASSKEQIYDLNSYNMIQILDTLEKKDKVYKNIIPKYLDYRDKFLAKDFRHWLYIETSPILHFPGSLIFSQYVQPFFTNYEKGEFVKYSKDEYHELTKDLIDVYYLNNVHKSFKDIAIQVNGWDLSSHDIRNRIIENIRGAWGNICDLYILREFFRISDTKEYIVVIGEMHTINLNNYFINFLCDLHKIAPYNKTYFCKLNNSQISKEKSLYNCISLDNIAYLEKDTGKKRMRNMFDDCKEKK